MLKAQNLVWNIGNKAIINDISLTVKSGKFLGVIGPNGSGKSSLMALLAGIRRPNSGDIYLSNKSMFDMRRVEVARQLAFVEQHADTSERLSVRQATELGRTPHLSFLAPFSLKDRQIVDEALAKTDMLKMADRIWQTLSGGEKQRVHFSRAFAQQPQIMLLDEPTNHLDIHHQLALLSLVRNEDLTIIAALHDLNHAAMFCDEIIVLNHGAIVAYGAPEEVLTAQIIGEIFKVHVQVTMLACGNLNIRYIAPHNLKTYSTSTNQQTIRNCA